MIKNIFFDFDGVIVNSNNIKTKAFLDLYKNCDKNILKKIKEHHINNGGMSRFDKINFYHKNFLKEKINKKKIQELSNIFSKYVFKKVVKSKFMPGFKNFINNNSYYNLYIISATPEEELKKISLQKKISIFFKGIYGSPKYKKNIIMDIINKNKYKKKECLFIGDSINDLEAANKTQINFLCFGNDFKSHKYKHLNKINNFSKLKKIIKMYEN